MNSESVKTVKRVVPLGVFAVAGWYTYKKRENIQEAILFGGIVALLAYLLLGPLVEKVVSLSGRPSAASYETKDLPQGWKPEALTRQLFDDIENTQWGPFTSRNNSASTLSLYQVVSTLNDAQLKAIYNYWRDTFYTENNQTLTQAMGEEFYGWGGVNDAAQKVMTRLKALNCY